MKRQQKYKRKEDYLHHLNGNCTLQLSSLLWGLSDRKEEPSTPYAQGRIEGETATSKPLSLDGEKFCSEIPPLSMQKKETQDLLLVMNATNSITLLT
ncbi:hypothetical protein AVEN_111705-1 [Araneus ventricosus]|uniref:Uncharacterized protein n=1 Tax=Araneus ventricosus TaxID=182803 RepID=A0A4Y2C808_ARAVE|nr:hypothetical protein AVEN_111705-1 [Araneus ventricosus]